MKFFNTVPLSKRRRDNNVFIVSAFLTLLIFSILIDPRDVSILACHLQNATGYSCPTCGLSRSFYAMAHLDITNAFGFHLLGPLFYFLIVLFFTKHSAELVLKKEIQGTWRPAITRMIFISLIILWILIWSKNFLATL